jgi:hypothetical protein
MIVIPMAGESRRFAEAGYTVPKYRLPVHGRALFDWAVGSFAAYFASQRFVFVLRAEAEAFVAARVRALGIASTTIVALDAPTRGQAETVEHGLDGAEAAPHEDLAIFNIDTIRPAAPADALPGCAGWLETFAAPGEHWSFVAPDPADPERVARTAEKERISDHCCTGLYQFAQVEAFRAALAAERAAPSAHELFVAPLYNHLIARGERIGWREVDAQSVLLAGVPAEYEALCAGGDAARLMAVFETGR